MDMQKARKLSYDLRRQTTWGSMKLRADIEGDRIVFSGGKHGTHSLAVDVSSQARILAHWEGYCENNGLPAPQPGQKLSFVGNNGCVYRGTVTKVGPKRVGMDFRYKNGRASHHSVPYADLRFQGASNV